MKSHLQWLYAPRDAAPLAAFRIVFGALLAFEAFASYLHKVPERYAPDMFHFTYPGFHWVAPPPGVGIYFLIGLMGLAAVCVTLGYRYRIAIGTFLFSYTYLFLIERAAYNNHYYLIILLAFLFLLTDAHATAAVDSSRLPEGRRELIPAWQLYIFRTQVAMVYFFGGVAKLSPDWLQREPITQWTQARAEILAAGPLLGLEIVPYILAYGGLVFDLSIGFLLLWRRTRTVAVVLVLGFHLTNAYIFSIGVFPWLGIGATVLFLDAELVRRIMYRLGYTAQRIVTPPGGVAVVRYSRWVPVFCTVYLLIQVVLPFRHWYFPGDVNWTEEGHDFSWHMKLRGKDGAIRYRVVDRVTGAEEVLDEETLSDMLSAKQLRRIIGRPVFLAQYAAFLREYYREKGFEDPAVYADTLLSLNGRPPQPLVDPAVDLSRVENRQFEAADWILPLDPDGKPGVFRSRPVLAQRE